MKLTKEDIKEFIPHRAPFLFIDSVESMTLLPENEEKFEGVKSSIGGTVNAKFFVDPELEILRGHFPGNPILPGVVQVEMMAQAACMILKKSLNPNKEYNLEVALLTTDKAKFRKPITPNMHLDIWVKCIKVRGPMLHYEGNIKCEGELLSEASFLASCKVSEK